MVDVAGEPRFFIWRCSTPTAQPSPSLAILISVIEILYEEAAFLLVNKPAGLFTQAARGVDSLEVRAREFLTARDGQAGQAFVGLPHRLDRGTSGVVLLAKNQRALKQFNEQFQARTITKEYLAITHDQIPEAKGSWVDWVRKIPDQPQAEIVAPETPDGRNAVLHFRRIASEAEASLLLVQLETGRMHQIRIQAASRGFPVFGDQMYGSTVSWGNDKSNLDHPPHALHALWLAFRHPKTALPIRITAPLPEAWTDVMHPNAIETLIAAARKTEQESFSKSLNKAAAK